MPLIELGLYTDRKRAGLKSQNIDYDGCICRQDERICYVFPSEGASRLRDVFNINAMRWLLDNRGNVEKSLASSLQKAIGEKLEKTTEEQKKAAERAKAIAVPESSVQITQDKMLSSKNLEKQQKSSMSEKTHRKIQGTMSWMRSLVEREAEGASGIKPGEPHYEAAKAALRNAKNAAVLLDQLERTVSRKWEESRKTEPVKEVERDYDGLDR
ncbi:MAG: hypothetical protein J6Y93_05115 [Treponema sp.]|nr:hypothetical protein [Treponema sp.]